jgi:hypothetical protein
MCLQVEGHPEPAAGHLHADEEHRASLRCILHFRCGGDPISLSASVALRLLLIQCQALMQTCALAGLLEGAWPEACHNAADRPAPSRGVGSAWLRRSCCRLTGSTLADDDFHLLRWGTANIHQSLDSDALHCLNQGMSHYCTYTIETMLSMTLLHHPLHLLKRQEGKVAIEIKRPFAIDLTLTLCMMLTLTKHRGSCCGAACGYV